MKVQMTGDNTSAAITDWWSLDIHQCSWCLQNNLLLPTSTGDSTIVKHSSQLLELPLSFMLVEENVADKSVIGLAKESAIDDFIPRFHDLAFLHFQ